jgi:outer membrane immunogenic protein
MTVSTALRGIFACGLAGATVFALLGNTAAAQGEGSQRISVQGFGVLTDGSDEPDRGYDATSSGGFLVGYSFQFNGWARVEANYGWTRNTHAYATFPGATEIPANLHQMTGALVGHFNRSGRYRPYALTGGGVLLFDPRVDVTTLGGPVTETKPAFLYGGGLELDLTSKVAARVEYRGFLVDTPDFGISGLSLGRTTHLAQPSAGVVFRF